MLQKQTAAAATSFFLFLICKTLIYTNNNTLLHTVDVCLCMLYKLFVFLSYIYENKNIRLNLVHDIWFKTY